MNKIYKIVWNAAQEAWVAVSELAKGHVKASSSGKNAKQSTVVEEEGSASSTLYSLGKAAANAMVIGGVAVTLLSLSQTAQAAEVELTEENLIGKNIQISQRPAQNGRITGPVVGQQINITNSEVRLSSIFGQHTNITEKSDVWRSLINAQVTNLTNATVYHSVLSLHDSQITGKSNITRSLVNAGLTNVTNGSLVLHSMVNTFRTNINNASVTRSVLSLQDSNITGRVQDSTIIGADNNINGDRLLYNLTAIGSHNSFSFDAAHSNVVGTGNKLTTYRTSVLGNGINATVSNSVYLGDASEVYNSINGVNGRTAATATYTVETMADFSTVNFAGGNNVVGAVSVGNATATRRIQNVAPGYYDANSTDAVNGSQLFAVGEIAGTANATANAAKLAAAEADKKAVAAQARADAAHGLATTANTTANDALTKANAAGTAASNAQKRADAAHSLATTANTTAGEAKDAADAAQTRADDAYDLAGTAGEEARTANNAAGVAKNRADEAYNLANQANGNANTALTKANAADAKAVSAQADATKAKSDAAAAKNDAGQALTKAGEAKTAAAAADTKAGQALTKAGEAAQAAAAADTKAGKAQKRADDAYELASQADTKAGEAKTAAAAADTKAGEAKDAAKAADDKAVAAKGRADDAYNLASQADTKADGAVAKAEAADAKAVAADTKAVAADAKAVAADAKAVAADAKAVAADAKAVAADAKAVAADTKAGKAAEAAQAADAKAVAADTKAGKAAEAAQAADAKAVAADTKAGKAATDAANALTTANGIDGKVSKALQAVDKGWTLQTEPGTETTINAANNVVRFKAGDNIKISQTGGNITVALTNDINVTKVTAGTVVAGNLTAKNATLGGAGHTVKVENGTNVDMGGNQIHNVGDGVKDSDAATVGQLNRALDQVAGSPAKINELNNRVDKMNKEMRGYAANAMAVTALPQVYTAGDSMISAAVGSQGGAASVAVGYSRASDNGKVVIKLNMAASSSGEKGVAAGVGYKW